MFYSSTIFVSSGFDPRVGTALVGIVNVISTFLSTFLLTYFGRKTLLWTMSVAMCADLIGLGIAFIYNVGNLQIVLVLLFVVLFEFSLGPIVWIYMSEIMTDKGQSLGTLVNWILTIIMAIITPMVLNAIHGWLFIIFGIACGITAFFTLAFVKETRGLDEAQVANLFNKEKKTYQNLDASSATNTD
jgi:MFS family permease